MAPLFERGLLDVCCIYMSDYSFINLSPSKRARGGGSSSKRGERAHTPDTLSLHSPSILISALFDAQAVDGRCS